MRTAQSRHKSYADRHRRPLEFQEEEHVFLRVTPTTGVGRALKSKKLTLKKYIADPSHIIGPDNIQLKGNFIFGVPPISIANRTTKHLGGKKILLVKVIWNQTIGDATWELEEKMI
ncbi:uncharacterized protein [Cicer arietinum]|uniref:uncharacterized protein n=1 Tax=Cicer arietinum TaxID=3827 RepID=UPI003CC65925